MRPITEPRPPVDVRLIYEDNSEVAVSCVYDGRAADGLHRWIVVDAPHDEPPVGMKIGKLPPATKITLRWELDA